MISNKLKSFTHILSILIIHYSLIKKLYRKFIFTLIITKDIKEYQFYPIKIISIINFQFNYVINYFCQVYYNLLFINNYFHINNIIYQIMTNFIHSLEFLLILITILNLLISINLTKIITIMHIIYKLVIIKY